MHGVKDNTELRGLCLMLDKIIVTNMVIFPSTPQTGHPFCGSLEKPVLPVLNLLIFDTLTCFFQMPSFSNTYTYMHTWMTHTHTFCKISKADVQQTV